MCSTRLPDAYESTETHRDTRQWIPSTATEEDGRNDKIHFVCDIATVLCKTKEDATSFVLHCGGAPKEQSEEHELFSKLFSTAPKNGDGYDLMARKSSSSFDGQAFQAPWFKGKLRFRRVPFSRPGEGSGIAVVVTADLFLNVNRALNHRRAELAEGAADAIFKSAAPVKRGLCGNDNLAPFDLEDGEHDHARQACFTAVIDAIYADVKRAAETAEDAGSEMALVTERPRNFSLWKVETCWDIGGAGFDAVQVLADIAPSLHELGGRKCSEGNARAVTIEFTEWEHLIVYAKAPDRLRFEIRHYPRNGSHRYSSPTIAETLAKLDRLREAATDTLNGVLSFLEGPPAASRTAGEWEAYAMAWGACCGVSGPATALFRILRQSGRIYGGKRIQCVQGGEALLRKAKEAGLIRHSHGAFRPVFPNAPDAALTGFDSAALMMGHESETQTVPSGLANGLFSRLPTRLEGVPPSPPL